LQAPNPIAMFDLLWTMPIAEGQTASNYYPPLGLLVGNKSADEVCHFIQNHLLELL
jgi:hypothetical protein